MRVEFSQTRLTIIVEDQHCVDHDALDIFSPFILHAYATWLRGLRIPHSDSEVHVGW